jgi:hypothetical protein
MHGQQNIKLSITQHHTMANDKRYKGLRIEKCFPSYRGVKVYVCYQFQRAEEFVY